MQLLYDTPNCCLPKSIVSKFDCLPSMTALLLAYVSSSVRPLKHFAIKQKISDDRNRNDTKNSCAQLDENVSKMNENVSKWTKVEEKWPNFLFWSYTTAIMIMFELCCHVHLRNENFKTWKKSFFKKI